jgi:hypothetical protein
VPPCRTNACLSLLDVQLRAIHDCVKLLALWLLLTAALDRSASAIEVEEMLWGFDGQVVIDRFTPLSVLVSNPTDQPVEAALQLQKHGRGAAQKLGAAIVESVYLSPFASRWVQFYPYITNEWDEWSLTWGKRPQQHYELKRPRPGRSAAVALVDRDSLSTTTFSVSTFPENLFPTVVAATGGLKALILDHAPRWQKPRRYAFLNWIYRGGRVGLLPDTDGQYPEFGEQLSVLNAPLPKQRLGSGTVVRLDCADDATVNRFLTTPADASSAEQIPKPPADGESPDGQSHYAWQLGPKVITTLQRMTQPEHNWPLIHGLSLTYLATLFPGWYLWSRRRVDFRIMLASFAVVALSFGFVFYSVGRRGYGETTSVNSVAIARPLSGDAYDVLQWSNVFVTDGNAYKMSYGGGGHLYSTCQQFEQVNGVIDNGLDGYFMVDIPRFSSRNFAHHGYVSQPHIVAEIVTFGVDGGELKELGLKIDDSFPSQQLTVQILYKDKIYRLSRKESELQLIGSGRPIAEYLQTTDEFSAWSNANNPWYRDEKLTDPRTLYDSLLPPLVARALEIEDPPEAAKYSLPEDRLRLLLYAPATTPFFIDSELLSRQAGYVLYVTDIFTPESL